MQLGTLSFRPRLMDSHQFTSHLQRRLNLRNVDRLELIELLPQSEANYTEGIAKAVYAYGRIHEGKVTVISLGPSTIASRSQFEMQNMTTPSDLRGSRVIPSLDIRNGVVERNASNAYYSSFYSNKIKARFTESGNPSVYRDEIRFISGNRGELINGPIANYTTGNSVMSFLQTSKTLLALRKTRNGRTEAFRRNVIRSTFLPGVFLTELFYPTVVKTNSGFDPAMFIDSTAILTSNIMLWQVGETVANVPLRFNVLIPDTCLTLDQTKWEADGTMAAALHCQDPETGQNYLKFYPFVE